MKRRRWSSISQENLTVVWLSPCSRRERVALKRLDVSTSNTCAASNNKGLKEGQPTVLDDS
jgi:hypothetical protein